MKYGETITVMVKLEITRQPSTYLVKATSSNTGRMEASRAARNEGGDDLCDAAGRTVSELLHGGWSKYVKLDDAAEVISLKPEAQVIYDNLKQIFGKE